MVFLFTLFFVLPPLPGSQASAEPYFLDITAKAGLDFIHFNGMTGEFLLPEIMGAGCALLDYDRDGDLDIYLVQGDVYPGGKTKAPLQTPAEGPPRDRLLRNLGSIKGVPKFEDVTREAGIPAGGFGMGVAAGDYDNDGYTDLFITNLGPNRLLHNNGDGSFEDRTTQAGLGGDELSTSAIFFDMDRDGRLDLFYANYVIFSPENSPDCYAKNSALDYCGPNAYTPARDRFFRNLGNGRFEDRSAWLVVEPAQGLGVTLLDADGDGWLDLYVANDGAPNHLWRNRAGQNLEDIALFAGLALNGEGVPEAGMGVSAADYDNDGDEDLFLTHLESESNTLYVNQGEGFFDDASQSSGLALPSLPFTGFGTGWFDMDLDGDLDLVVINGAVRTQLDQVKPGDDFPLKQRNQLYLNDGKGGFVERSQAGGPAFQSSEVSRGVALGDVNNDGALDLLISNNHGPARLLLNRAGRGQHWLGVAVRGKGKRSHALGALVRLTTEDGRLVTHRINRGGSYLSSRDPRLVFGLGRAKGYTRLQIIWPDGHSRTLPAGPINTYLEISRKDGP